MKVKITNIFDEIIFHQRCIDKLREDLEIEQASCLHNDVVTCDADTNYYHNKRCNDCNYTWRDGDY